MVVKRHAMRSHSIRDRTKNTRLNGADLYVVRLGSKSCCEGLDTDTKIESPSEILSPRSSTGSLYDELVHGNTENTMSKRHPSPKIEKLPTILFSRPCHLCISYMASVGIKRAFWSDGSGNWDSAKVRDMIDGLEAGLGLS